MGKENLISFWRMCRSVSTEKRLQLLWALFEKGDLCVWQLAEMTSMKKPVASAQLKILHSCGLIRFRREGMHVIYRAEAFVQIENAVELLEILKKWHGDQVPLEKVIRQITAFTHERRIEIVQALKDGPLAFLPLQSRCGMTSSALSRHLVKLEARRVVRKDGKLYYTPRSPEWPERRLLTIARERA